MTTIDVINPSGNISGYQALATAVLHQAVLDARHGSRSAREWLLDTGVIIVDLLLDGDLDMQWWESYVRAGCPKDPSNSGAKRKRERQREWQ